MYRYRGRKNQQYQQYKKFALNTIILALAVVIVSILFSSIKNEFDAEEAVAEVSNSSDVASQQHSSEYLHESNNSTKGRTSQETSRPKPTPTQLPAAITRPTPSPTVKPTPQPTNTPAPEKYIVTIQSGRVCVVDAESSEILNILDIPLSMLPQEDIELLESGIELNGVSALKAFIEDYE